MNTNSTKNRLKLHALLALAGGTLLSSAAIAQPLPQLPPVPVPAENPITESKRVLGKILFWDEQLSVDGTMACATCHSFANGGADTRRVRTAGPDGILGTQANPSPDDIFGSPGVIHSDSFKDFVRDVTRGTNPQITGRNAMSPINAGYATDLFWDGRARSTYTDPQTGLVTIVSGGALESQAVGPITNSVEMGHDGVNWAEVNSRLTSAKPLALATNFPTDVAAVLNTNPTYPQLFQAAFGDATINSDRVAKAIATYERTLIANQTPYDISAANPGNPNVAGGLTPNQRQGLQIMGQNNRNCTVCHAPPNFTDNSFRNIGLRPPTEDPGRQNVTNAPNGADRDKMKVPSLRNVGLRTSYMHNGVFTTIQQVFGFYDHAPGNIQFTDNLDPLMANTRIPPGDGGLVDDFIRNGLRDPRVAAETAPFDHPTLFTRRPADQPVINNGAGTPGTGGIKPTIIAVSPAMLGNPDFRIGLDNALGGATAHLMISFSPPVNGRLNATQTFATKTTTGTGPGNGLATNHWVLSGAGLSSGQTIFAQWIVDDPAAAGGQAFSTVASFRLFCPSSGCTGVCATDYNGDGLSNVTDIFSFLTLWFSGDPRADFDHSNILTPADIFSYLTSWFAGC